MHSFTERQKPTQSAAPANASLKSARHGFVRHTPSDFDGASRQERAAQAVDVENEAARVLTQGFDLTRVPVTQPAIQRKPFVGPLTDEPERKADAQTSQNDGSALRLSPLSSPVIQRQTATAPTQPPAQKAQTTSTTSTPTSDYESYQAEQEKVERFRAGAPYFLHNYKPTTGRGFFDAMYYPPNFYVTVKVGFYFINSDLDWWKQNGAPKAKSEDVTWTDAEKEDWKQRYLTDVSAKWTNENYLLFCTKPWWESLTAQVVVRFNDVEKSIPQGLGLDKGDVKSHFDLIIKKIPKGQSLQSYTSSPTGKSTMEGTVALNSEGLTPARNDSGNKQRSAVHESAHMLGLGDTYVPDDKESAATEASHAALAKKELGVNTPIKDDARLTSRGEQMDKSDAVTFVEAIRATTKMPDWSLTSKPMKPIPKTPTPFNDLVTPRETMG